MKYFSMTSKFRRRTISILSSVLTWSVLCTGKAVAAEYVISEASQLQSTFSKLEPGDTVTIEGGDYHPSIANSPYNHLLIRDKNGSSNAWITIRNRPGTRPKIFLGGTVMGLTIINSSYIRIEGLELVGKADNVETFGLAASGHHLQIVDNIVHGFRGNCISPAGSQLLVEGNVVFDCAKTRRPWGPSGISIYQPEVRSQNNGDFAGPLGNPSNAYSIIIRNNIVRDVHQLTPVEGMDYLSDGNGIILDDFNQTQRPEGQRTPFSQRTLVANNLIFDNGGHGIHVFHSEHVDVVNNTLYQNSKDLGLSRALDGELSNWGADNHYHNNLVYTRPGTKGSVTDGSPNTTWSNNLYFGDVGRVPGTDDLVNVDPKFKAPGLTLAADFSIDQSSPAVGRGKGGFGVNQDIEGRERPSRPSIGAFEADAVEPLPTATPSATPTSRPTSTATPRPTSTPAATATATSTATPRSTPTIGATRTPRPTASSTPTPRPTVTPIRTPASTPTTRPRQGKIEMISRVPKTSPKIDGALHRDAGWAAARPLPLRNRILGTTSSSATARVTYNNQNLFIAFKVDDRNGVATPSTEWWMNDGVEVFIDKDNSKSARYDSGDIQLHFSADGSSVKTVQGTLSGGIKHSRKITRSGYIVEIQIPWTALGISPKAGTTFGIDLAVTDRIGTGRAKLAWNAMVDDLWLSPKLFGSAMLK